MILDQLVQHLARQPGCDGQLIAAQPRDADFWDDLTSCVETPRELAVVLTREVLRRCPAMDDHRRDYTAYIFDVLASICFYQQGGEIRLNLLACLSKVASMFVSADPATLDLEPVLQVCRQEARRRGL